MQCKVVTRSWIEQIIRDFLDNPNNNSLRRRFREKAWDNPLVGFSRGGDSLYQKLKEDIGQFYWTPMEIFLKTLPNSQVAPDELTVIAWILPQTEVTRFDNRKENVYVSERWAQSAFLEKKPMITFAGMWWQSSKRRDTKLWLLWHLRSGSKEYQRSMVSLLLGQNATQHMSPV